MIGTKEQLGAAIGRGLEFARDSQEEVPAGPGQAILAHIVAAAALSAVYRPGVDEAQFGTLAREMFRIVRPFTAAAKASVAARRVDRS